MSNRDAIQAITASTGAALVVVPTLLREGAAWRARVELRDPQIANNVWEHETSSKTSSLTRDVAYRLAMVLSVDIETHLKSRRASVLETLMGLWPSGGQQPSGRVRSLDAAKAFADGTAWIRRFRIRAGATVVPRGGRARSAKSSAVGVVESRLAASQR